MARIIGALASSHTPTIGFAFDRNKRDDPAWAPIFEHYEPLQQWIDGQEARRDGVHLQRSRDVVLLRSLLGVHARHRRTVSGGGRRRRRRGRCRRRSGHPALARHIGQALMADEFDMSFFQDKPLDHGLFSPLSMLARRNDDGRVAGADHPAARRRPAVSDSVGAALLQARAVAAARHRELSGRSEGGDRRHRRPVAPGARRAVGLQQHAVGHAVPRADRKRSRAALRADARGVRRVRRLRRLRSDHVAGDARRAVGEHPEGPPELLPAVDDRDRDGDLRERGVDRRRQQRRGIPSSHGAAARRRRADSRHLSVHARAQRQGVPAEQVPARHDRSRRTASSSLPIPKRRSRRPD